MKKYFCLLFLIMLSACNSDNSGDRASLETTVAAFNKAFKLGQLQILDSLTTDNYTHTNGDDRAFSKESWFSYLESRSIEIQAGTLKIDRYELLEKGMAVYGDAAIVTGLIISSGSSNGQPFENQIRVSNFWVKEEGTWKRAGFHDTRVE